MSCIEESACHEMAIELLKRFKSCLKCLFLHVSISLIYVFHVDADSMLVAILHMPYCIRGTFFMFVER